MTTWLQQQEALVCCDAYLAWALLNDGASSAGSGDEDSDGEEDNTEMEGEDDRDVLPPGEASDNHDAQEADYKMLKTLKTRDLGKDASGLCKAMSLVWLKWPVLFGLDRS